MRIVLDTNVLVSGVLRPGSIPALVLSALSRGQIRAIVDDRILTEYQAVLVRPRLRLPPTLVVDVLASFAELAEHIVVPPDVVRRFDRVVLPDAGDRPFIEVTVAARANALVTGNIPDFPPAALAPALLFTPRQLLDALGEI